MSRPRVLLLLDSREEAEMYENGLRPDFQVVTACVDPDATANDADVIVANDIGAAGGPAWDVLERFCGSAGRPPTVLLTAHIRADRAVRDRVRQLGCAAFVAKPCTPAALVAVLHRVLAGERGIEHTHWE